MRIAIIGSKGLPSKSGIERVVEGIATHLRTQHMITVYCDSRYTPPGTRMEGVRLVRIPTLKGKYVQPVSLFVLSALHAMFGRYDLVHVHGTDACFMLPLLRLRYKVITTSHGIPGRVTRLKWGKVARFLIRAMEQPFVYLSSYRTSVSAPDADYIRARYDRDIAYIPNGVEPDIQFDCGRAGSKLMEAGLQPGEFVMFAAGRIDPSKGCHLVLEALLHMERPAKLAVVGDLNQLPAYSEHLKQIADHNRAVFFPPTSDRQLLFGMVKQARLFVFPSLSEGMSMMLLEAASLEVPIICSDIPENKLVMRENALYFHSGDAADLAVKMQWALDQPREMACLARSASTYVKNTLTWDRIAAQYDELYRQCTRAN